MKWRHESAMLGGGVCVASVFIFLSVWKVFGQDFWWFGLVFVTLFLEIYKARILPAFKLLESLDRERLDLNWQASGHKESIKNKKIWPFHFVTLVFLVVIGYFSSVTLKSDVYKYSKQFLTWIQPETPMLKIEFSSYLEKEPVRIELSRGKETQIEADIDSLLSIEVLNKKPESKWNLTWKMESQNPPQSLGELSSTLGSYGFWTQAVRSLYKKFNYAEDKNTTLDLVFKNENKQYLVKIVVLAMPKPIVTLKSAGQRQMEDEGDAPQRLFFNVEVESPKVPLTRIELNVRTQSGFQFVKTLAEFANANEKTFDVDDAEVLTAGIPFAAKDSLFVKAVARTVVNEVVGESEEIEFKIQSTQEIRQRLIQELEAAKESWNKKLSVEEWKKQLSQHLEEAEKNMQSMKGVHSSLKKKLSDAMRHSQEIQKKGDPAAKTTKKDIEAILEALKRAQSTDEFANFLLRLSNLKASLMTPQNNTELKKRAVDAQELKKKSQQIRGQLERMVDQPSSALTLQERQEAHRLLKQDQTENKLNAGEQDLQKAQQSQALKSIDDALQQTIKGGGKVLQMLGQARQRALQKAREKLTEADSQLSEARKHPEDTKKEQKELQEGKQALKDVPQLSQNFNSSVDEAQRHADKAAQKAKGNKRNEMLESISDAQNAIVDALMALQEEEQEEREQQEQSDIRNSHASLEALSAQSQLDAGWRKKILEQIARLRSQGEPSDSPLLKYLEGQLK